MSNANEPAETGSPVEEGATASAPSRRRSNRSILAGVLWVVASLAIMVSAVTLWAHQSVLTTAGWTNIVSQVAADPEVMASTSTAVASRISDSIGLEDIVAGVLPDALSIVSGAVTSRIEDAVAGVIAEAASTEASQEAFVKVNALAFDAAMKVIRDEGTAVTTEVGSIELNVFPLIGVALTGLQDAGIIDASREIPDLTEFQPDADNVARLEEVLGRDLPSDLGTITLIQSDQLAGVQTAVRNFDLITVGLLLFAILCIALTLWLSQARLRMVLWLAIGSIAALALGRLFTRIVAEGITGSLQDGPQGETVRGVVGASVNQLMWFTFAVIVIALVIAGIVMWYERRAVTAGAGRAEPRSLADWLRANVRTIGTAGLGVIGFIVLWDVGGPDIALLAGAAVGVWLIAVNLLAEHKENVGEAASEPGSA